jgi:uncharacterized protein YrrD
MLMSSSVILNAPIISLRNGQKLGTTLGLIINPNNLKIEALSCNVSGVKETLYLLNNDIRDLSLKGILINDFEDLSEAHDLVRINDLIKLNFSLLNKTVCTVSKTKVGKVKDFAADNKSLFIQKLYVNQPIYKNLSGGQLVVDRKQIVDVTNSKVIINDLVITQKVEKTVLNASSIPHVA